MSHFVRYVSTAGERRLLVVQGMDEPYSPIKDPYRRMRSAIKAGQRLGDPEAAMANVVQNCPPRLRGHYAEIGRRWPGLACGFEDASLLENPTGSWQASGLSVRVTPDLVLKLHDDSVMVIKAHFQAEPLEPRNAEIMLWLMREAMSDSYPSAQPVVLDVRRSRRYDTVPVRSGFSAWMESEAASLRFLRERRSAA